MNPPEVAGVRRRFRRPGRDPIAGMPTTTMHLELTEHEHDGGSRMEVRAVYDTREQMEQLISIGTAEGLQQAIGQMDALFRN
jgi:hypothetical protein